MPASRPALALLLGATCPPVPRSTADALRLAELNVAYWEAAVDLAIDDLIDAPVCDRGAERSRLRLAEAKLELAVARRARVLAVSRGERWLRVVEVGS